MGLFDSLGKLGSNIVGGINDLANNPVKAVKDGLQDPATLAALAAAAGGYGLYQSGALGGNGGLGGLFGGSGAGAGAGAGLVGPAGTAAGADAAFGASGIPWAAGVDAGTTAAAGGGTGGGLWSLLSSPGAIQAGATLGGSLLQQNGLNNATDAQTAAADRATAASNAQFNAVLQRDQPLVDARNQSLAKMRELLGIGTSPAQSQAALTADPGYQFGLRQGMQSLNNSLASKGMRNSGAALQAATRYGNDYATTKFDSALNRYSNLAGLGQVGASSINAAGDTNASRVSDNALAQGNIGAINAIGSGNLWANAGNQLAGWYNNQKPGG